MKIEVPKEFNSKAIFSKCGYYRYFLKRDFIKKPKNILVYIMLNPSIADEKFNDPSVERCQRRAIGLGYDSFIILNIFSYISTDPKNLLKVKDPIGLENNKYIIDTIKKNKKIICAWGNNGKILDRGDFIIELLKKHKIKPKCFGVTISKQPKHPLYIAYSQKLLNL